MGWLREIFEVTPEQKALREARMKERERQREIERNLIHFMDMAEFPKKNVRLCDFYTGELKSSDRCFKTFDPNKVTCPRCKKEMAITGILEWKPAEKEA